MKKLLYIALGLTLGLSFSSCSEDNLGESIFDTDIPVVDPNSATAPFDQWLEDNFRKPFNTEIQYKFNLTSSPMNFQLAPADYGKSQLLAHLIKYLFYDVYNMYGEKRYYTDENGEEKVDTIFMRKYGPRIFHFIGSKAISGSTGTETLGYASGGVKITLINVNDMKMVQTDEDGHPTTQFTDAEIDNLNQYQFHTMHHEFSHIMHQTKVMPVDYTQVTPTGYVERNWQDVDSVSAHARGFTTHYACSGGSEDFVETLSSVITDTEHRWMLRIVNMCANGGYKVANKKQVYDLIDSLGITQEKLNDPNQPWNKLYFYEEFDNDEIPTGNRVTQYHLADAKDKNNASSDDKNYKYGIQITDPNNPDKKIIKEGVPTNYWTKEEADEENAKHMIADSKGRQPGDDGYKTTYEKGYKAKKEFDDKDALTFNDFINSLSDGNAAEVKGFEGFSKKLDIATKWYTEEWGLYLFQMRAEVQKRQKNLNEYLKGITIYKLLK